MFSRCFLLNWSNINSSEKKKHKTFITNFISPHAKLKFLPSFVRTPNNYYNSFLLLHFPENTQWKELKFIEITWTEQWWHCKGCNLF